ncbi:ribosome maturation factor RimM [Pediococcus claussenii]|uniref:Ribosome maturation factor RimM n=1 Tax=Pediococcus claussenii (strain ATCC BAA-344 / DSM 14800 / JCM 18046 / KCTC 3811 / LMG 21948 / P06) TaxID=701521 RepID=G8PDG5_PEDCP|nr:ribosome maturation factor RimM [Pediococcus claussenii]AEV95300.1 16S rRNA processing protein RimM [Pediococcus claussenii ATCC BAA-344]ANZ68835.1 ribosome maturation factor RimM [Pediococcus claussenii]ANZ70651.1 ribosome maturation factor RimM [Pediococcus claussenii]KRN19518.1 rimM protein [Pediococcus claussenii]
MEYFNVGKIVNTQGLRGEIKVISQTDFPEERFASGSILDLFNGDQKVQQVVIKHSRINKGTYILKLENFDSINEVEKFKGYSLKIAEDQLDELEEGQFYFHEIIGLKVIDQQRGEIGSIKDILPYGANDVWVVDTGNGKELLLPYIKSVILKVNTDQNEVLVDIPEGLE